MISLQKFQTSFCFLVVIVVTFQSIENPIDDKMEQIIVNENNSDTNQFFFGTCARYYVPKVLEDF